MSAATTSTARCAAGISTAENTSAALREAAALARESLGGAPDLALLFFSAHHVPDAERIAADARELLGTANVLGVTGESIVGTACEIEEGPALAVWLARWPGASISPMHLAFQRTPEGGALEGWPEHLAGEWPAGAFLIVMGDPFTFPADFLLERMNEDRPGVPVIGGMASGGHEPGMNRLLFGDQVLTEGAVAVLVSGPVRVRTVVSQGCRPIGRPLVITKAERNVIYELGGRPALIQLREIFDELPTSEQRLVQRALHVGRVVSEYRDHFEQGDFLVRNVVGIDSSSGAVAIGDYIRPGQTVQFHVRDQEAADAELKQLLSAAQKENAAPLGGLLFTCNGRGTRMFSQPHHDAAAISRAFGPLPLAGFFAAGEIGPIGTQNFMHGFTASVALFVG
ncbi:MAG TPA: FIST N-terminal domain-containing protein [Pirellulaceae bacterium]|nr:FIST N-terminal domain-containing protein [Pirellulaceae bacterium]